VSGAASRRPAPLEPEANLVFETRAGPYSGNVRRTSFCDRRTAPGSEGVVRLPFQRKERLKGKGFIFINQLSSIFYPLEREQVMFSPGTMTGKGQHQHGLESILAFRVDIGLATLGTA